MAPISYMVWTGHDCFHSRLHRGRAKTSVCPQALAVHRMPRFAHIPSPVRTAVNGKSRFLQRQNGQKISIQPIHATTRPTSPQPATQSDRAIISSLTEPAPEVPGEGSVPLKAGAGPSIANYVCPHHVARFCAPGRGKREEEWLTSYRAEEEKSFRAASRVVGAGGL